MQYAKKTLKCKNGKAQHKQKWSGPRHTGWNRNKSFCENAFLGSLFDDDYIQSIVPVLNLWITTIAAGFARNSGSDVPNIDIATWIGKCQNTEQLKKMKWFKIRVGKYKIQKMRKCPNVKWEKSTIFLKMQKWKYNKQEWSGTGHTGITRWKSFCKNAFWDHFLAMNTFKA